MTPKSAVLVGSRSSALARRQTNEVLGALRGFLPELEFVVRDYDTFGDRRTDRPLHELGDTSPFTKELETALLGGEIDIAVHSLKDLPAVLPDGLCLGAVFRRLDPRDVILSVRCHTLATLPAGARLGTSSLRRRVQLQRHRPGLTLVEIRGNVDTRIAKMESGFYDALALAAAGVLRMGREDLLTEYIPADICLPAPGQGALGLEVRAGDGVTLEVVGRVNDAETAAAATAERAFCRGLAAGCQAPLGALASVHGANLEVRGMVASLDGGRLLDGAVAGPASEAEALGRALAEKLAAGGAREIIASCLKGALP